MPSSKDVQSVEAASRVGTIYLILTQIVSRALTFIGNQFLLRYVSPTLLGLAVQLELLSITILYTARESLRVALQRQPAGSQLFASNSLNEHAQLERRTLYQRTVNLAYLVIGVGLCASCIFGYGYLHGSKSEVLQSTDFWRAFELYGLATFLELCAEPCFVVIQQQSLYKARARAETGAAIVKCVSACLTAIIMHRRQLPASVLPFAVGQLCYAGTLSSAYLAVVIPMAGVTRFSLLPRKVSEAQTALSRDYWFGLIYKPLLILTTTFYGQSLFKLILTTGDSLILSFVADLKSQGAFALASNYGGLLSRLLFQPIEESSRNIFGQLLTPGTDQPAASRILPEHDNDTIQQNDASRSTSTAETHPPHQATTPSSAASTPAYTSVASTGVETDQGTRPTTTSTSTSSEQSVASNTAKALTHLTTTIHAYTLFSLPLVALLPHVLPALIQTIIGRSWATAETSRLLAAYAYYLPFMALNGILDAFVTSVATPRQVSAQAIIMFAITIAYGLTAWVLMTTPSLAMTRTTAVTTMKTPMTHSSLNQDGRSGSQIDSSGTVMGLMSGFGFKLEAKVRSLAGLGFGMGPVGLVWANVSNMTMRIAYSIWFIQRWAASHAPKGPQDVGGLWKRGMPNVVCVFTALAVAIGLNRVVGYADSSSGKTFLVVKGLNVTEVGYLLTGTVILATSMLVFEHQFLFSLLSSVLPQRLTSQIVLYLPKQKKL